MKNLNLQTVIIIVAIAIILYFVMPFLLKLLSVVFYLLLAIAIFYAYKKGWISTFFEFLKNKR